MRWLRHSDFLSMQMSSNPHIEAKRQRNAAPMRKIKMTERSAHHNILTFEITTRDAVKRSEVNAISLQSEDGHISNHATHPSAVTPRFNTSIQKLLLLKTSYARRAAQIFRRVWNSFFVRFFVGAAI